MLKSMGWLTAAAALGLGCVVLADEKPADAQDPAALFATLDKNQDGQLSTDEIAADNKRLFERLLRLGDKNADGRLTADEFTAALKPDEPAETPPVDAKQARRFARDMFERLDANGDKKIATSEVPEPRRERFQQLIDRGDKDGDGALDEKEFLRAFAAAAAARKSDEPKSESKSKSKSAAAKSESEKSESAKVEPAKTKPAKPAKTGAKKRPRAPGRAALQTHGPQWRRQADGRGSA